MNPAIEVADLANVYAELGAWDNLMFTASLHRVPRAQRDERARQWLEAFGLWKKLDRR